MFCCYFLRAGSLRVLRTSGTLKFDNQKHSKEIYQQIKAVSEMIVFGIQSKRLICDELCSTDNKRCVASSSGEYFLLFTNQVPSDDDIITVSNAGAKTQTKIKL